MEPVPYGLQGSIMSEREWMREEAARSLERLLPRVRAALTEARATDPTGYAGFEVRLQREWPRLFALLLQLRSTTFQLDRKFFKLAALVVGKVVQSEQLAEFAE